MRLLPLYMLPAWLAACSGGSSHQLQIGPPPARLTTGVLSGGLCDGDHCTCRDIKAPGDGGAGFPTDDKKRFEVRLGPSPQELWATIGGTTLYKSPERAEACFYVDLPAGETPVELRASSPEGVSAALTIRELGTKTKSWYNSFEFKCGSPGTCSFEELDENKRDLEKLKNHVADYCGSVKIRGLTWDTGKAPDELHPGELLVRLALSVYKRVPTQAHGDPSCGHGPPPKEAPAPPAAAAPAHTEDEAH